MTPFRPSLLAALLLLAGPRADAFCNERIHSATPTARFTVNANGTATDTRTGLTWQRCPMGTTLDDGGTPAFLGDDSCVATPNAAQSFSWGGALQAVDQLNAGGGTGGFSDWRVPNRKELLSIVETRCVGPSINVQVFPDTPPEEFFSSTSYASVRTLAFAINFGQGGETPVPKASVVRLRLVR